MRTPSAVRRELQVPGAVLRRLAARFPDRYPVLMDSAAEGPLSRSSILAAMPRAALWLAADGTLRTEGVALPPATGFFDALEQWWRAEQLPPQPGGCVFAGGWAVFVGYEVAREIEPRLVLPAATLPWQAFALRTPCAVIHDLRANQVFAVAEAEAAHRLDEIEADVRAVASEAAPAPPARVRVASILEEPGEVHLDRVVRAKEYIRAGDIYQANLSRPWHITLAEDARAPQLYEALCAANPAPFAALAQWGGAAILSSSPERLARIGPDRRIDTRPIAGTRPRSRKPGGDVAEITELAAHPKERAEHVMLIDLERNDLGRVCAPGTVRVDELMTIESYAHVHHIVSNVTGRLREEVTPIGALRAVFPGGTITGCPKVRCMEIIAELEGAGRGAYTGSIGFLGRDGTMDTNILIRTMTLMGREIELRAGGGVVADSIPERELEETRAKARGLLAVFDADASAVRSGAARS
ncbi:MAG TPA: aminodeoxychorismate synthase component I [Steroidobacteraceae bacterium]|nr:aminodeoxychorismate synthase component I [Steroidobacteraceae bacterium]